MGPDFYRSVLSATLLLSISLTHKPNARQPWCLGGAMWRKALPRDPRSIRHHWWPSGQDLWFQCRGSPAVRVPIRVRAEVRVTPESPLNNPNYLCGGKTLLFIPPLILSDFQYRWTAVYPNSFYPVITLQNSCFLNSLLPGNLVTGPYSLSARAPYFFVDKVSKYSILLLTHQAGGRAIF